MIDPIDPNAYNTHLKWNRPEAKGFYRREGFEACVRSAEKASQHATRKKRSCCNAKVCGRGQIQRKFLLWHFVTTEVFFVLALPLPLTLTLTLPLWRVHFSIFLQYSLTHSLSPPILFFSLSPPSTRIKVTCYNGSFFCDILHWKMCTLFCCCLPSENDILEMSNPRYHAAVHAIDRM